MQPISEPLTATRPSVDTGSIPAVANQLHSAAVGSEPRLRVLVASIPMPMNRFLVDLNAALSLQAEVTHDSDVFWNMQGDFDVVHLHFPEYLTFTLQEAYKTQLTDGLIDAVEERLNYWSDRAAIVVTRHVLLPHDALSNPVWERLYSVLYRYAHGVAHFAQASVDEFRERYSLERWHREEPKHVVIPHHNYRSLPNTVDRTEARKKLNIPATSRVMLVFGSIRNDEEAALVLTTFQRLQTRQKLLLVSTWRERLPNVRWIRLKYWLRDLKRLYYRLHPQYRFHYGFVDEADTQLYLNAADVLFIPRFRVLNSGNVTLGMTFGKVVVGPDSWDVGQLLRETGNPVFDPDRPETAARAVDEAFKLAEAGQVGPANQQLALREWSADQCADRYVNFFRTHFQRR